ncbi:hypothetical protein [Herbidospora mongoliensis]|uniref:hypothetical protein n=1 Tax=Herbidospora mongoliensis TaxID=688067 RepID=UPI000836D837|nr:hypothetical protein [Herbidospora mongoliensis]
MTDYDFVIPQGLLILGSDTRNRLYVEQEKLQAYFPQFTLTQKSGSGKVRAKGVLTTNTGRRYPVKIKLPDRYPHDIPKVFPVDWDSRSPHSYVDGHICIMRDDQWRTYFSVAFAVAKSALWLNKFDVWKSEGYWPGNEQEH